MCMKDRTHLFICLKTTEYFWTNTWKTANTGMVPGVRELDGQMPGWEKDFLCLLRYYILSIIAKKKIVCFIAVT